MEVEEEIVKFREILEALWKRYLEDPKYFTTCGGWAEVRTVEWGLKKKMGEEDLSR